MTKKKDNKRQELLRQIKTGRTDVILQLINELRNSGDDSLLPDIMRVLKDNHDDELKAAVIRLLNDLNQQSSAEVLVQELPGHEKMDYFSGMVGACWQNGLDYSQDMDYFIKLVLDKDYSTSLEAFTVVEGNINQVENKERENLANIIEKAKPGVGKDKTGLVDELLAVVRPYSGPFSVDSED